MAALEAEVTKLQSAFENTKKKAWNKDGYSKEQQAYYAAYNKLQAMKRAG